MDTAVELQALNKLKWRCRRGLLENDLLLERFFLRYESTLTEKQAQAVEALMELSDNDLLDLLLGRTTLKDELDEVHIRDVLAMMRMPALKN